MDLTSVDPIVGAAIVNLGASLSTLALKGTATVMHGKIESLKREKNADVIRTSYNEMINELLEERDEAVRIAQTYKNELEKVVISDEDIEYLQDTVSKVLDILVALQSNGTDEPDKKSKTEVGIEAVSNLKGLISKDVLKTMQLIGFNYKAAIGEPLTEICAESIRKLTQKGNTRTKQ